MSTIIKKKAKKKGKQIKFTDFNPSSDPAGQEIQTICPRQSQPPGEFQRSPVRTLIAKNEINYNKSSQAPPPKRSMLPGANLPQSNKQFTLPGANLDPAFSSNLFHSQQGPSYNNNSIAFNPPFQQQSELYNNIPPYDYTPFNMPQYTQPHYTQPQYNLPHYTQPQYNLPQYTQPQYTQPQYNLQQYNLSQYNTQNTQQPQCVTMANQAKQIAQALLPPQKQQHFNHMLNDFIIQSGTNRNYDANGAMKKLAQQLLPNAGYDDFQDYTQEQQPQTNMQSNLDARQMTDLDHKFMDMMEKKIEKQIDSEIRAAQEFKNRQVCKFYLSGCCKFGLSCKNYHPVGNQSYVSSIKFQDDQECCICFSFVRATNKQFGLLTGCDHAFCLQCIRKWRGQINYESSGKDQSRLCPICRKQSFVVLPSNGYIRGKEKQKMMALYRGRLKQLPCKHFNYGKEKCPFLNSCFYSHKLRDGTNYEYPFQTPQFSMQNQEWVEDDKNYQTLSSKLDIE